MTRTPDDAAIIAEMADLLNEIRDEIKALPVCPFCQRVQSVQYHKPDCPFNYIRAVIMRARGE